MIEKPKIKPLKNIDFLFELTFYAELSVIKTDHAFKGYAMSHKVEKKDALIQLESSKTIIKDLCNDLLNKTKGFKYQVKLTAVLKKHKGTEIKFSLVYFNSTAKIVINLKFDLDKSFQ